MYRSQPYAGMLKAWLGRAPRLKIKGSQLFSLGNTFEMLENLTVARKMESSFVT